MTQFSLFGAEAARPALDDLDGLLVAGAHWVRSGATARLSLVVPDPWRARELAAAFAERGVGGDDAIVPAVGNRATSGDDRAVGHGVRTAFCDILSTSAARWTRGANQVVPADFALASGGLRLWTIANGSRDDLGFLLRTPSADERLHHLAGAGLSRLGVAAVSLAKRGGPGWRITSARRLRRLAELVGPAPDGAGPDWPTLAQG